MSDDPVIARLAGVPQFSVGPDGSVTHVDDALLDEVAAVLWAHRANQANWVYDDERAYEHAYETLTPAARQDMRSIAQEAITPLLRRLVAAH